MISPILRCAILIVWTLVFFSGRSIAAEPSPQGDPQPLLGYWPLAGDARDHSSHERHANVRGAVKWQPKSGPGGRSGATFDGQSAHLEVPADSVPQLGTGDFSITAWVNLDEGLSDVPGDILSLYDPDKRRGVQLSIKTNVGVTTTQANDRQLQFVIDDHRQSSWTDCGRPGRAVLAFALAAAQGQLFAGTCEGEGDGRGHVYRYAGPDRWIDCGAPDACNAVTALAEYQGHLYAATGKYRLAGSSLAESSNSNLGGGVYRYAGEDRWIACGRLDGVEAIGGLVVFGGRLYASSLYQPAGFFRYEGNERWTALSTPGVRVEALGVYNGHLYATSYDRGQVYRFDGDTWTDCGQLGDAEENTQTYSLAVYQGRLFIGTWRSGRVYRFEEPGRWTDVGRLGEELEVMGMLVHNGRLLAGTLPLAEVYEYRGGHDWRRLAQLDSTPDVKYRRAWTMAEFGGQTFVSTLPSGHIHAYQVGASAMTATPFPTGWHHVAAVKSASELRLFLDGQQVAVSQTFNRADYELDVDVPLRIGFGQNDYFAGQLSEVRIHSRALSAQECQRDAASR